MVYRVNTLFLVPTLIFLRLLTDRYALPANVPSSCDPGEQTWCGGTWSAIRENLDYIQDAGFTAGPGFPLYRSSHLTLFSVDITR